MELDYSNSHKHKKSAQKQTDLSSLTKEFYLKFFPRLVKSFSRNEFLSCTLLLLLVLQEIALNFGHRQYLDSSSANDNYYSQFINAINYSLFVNVLKLSCSHTLAVQIVFYACFAVNLLFILTIMTIFTVYACYRFDPRKLRKLAFGVSGIISMYAYIIFLPSLNTSMIFYFDSSFGSQTQLVFAVINTILTWVMAIFVYLHDFEYSFKEYDKLAKRFSSLELWKIIFGGLIPLIFQISSESVLSAYCVCFGVVKLLIYYHDQTYYSERVSCFHSIMNVFYCASTVIFCIFQASDESKLDFTLLLLISLPLSAKLGKAIYNYLQNLVFMTCLGKPNMNFLTPKQLDIFLRLLNKNMSFFYEDYIDRDQGVIFENLYVSHQINCETTDYRCFCHDFRREDNKLEFEEYIGQDFRKKYVMFYIVNIYESFLGASGKDSSRYNSVMFAYISFLFEIMKISTKSFNVINIFSIRLAENSSGLIDHFYEQVLMYRTKTEFQHFFSNPTYQNQRLFILAPIMFDENLIVTRQLLREQLMNTAVFYDYLCSNFIDLSIVQKNAMLLYQNLLDLRQKLTLAYDLNPDNMQITSIAQLFSNYLEFENTKPSVFKKNSKHLSRRMLLPQDRNIKVFSKHSCVVYASLISKDGQIRKVTDSFARIYGIENQFILGKTLNSLIPKGLYNAHDDIISNFKNKGSMNIINKETRMVFGLNGEGFIIPLMIRLKLENMNDDFGVCSLLTSVNQEKEYLFISDEGMIMDITKRLYNRAVNLSLYYIFMGIDDLRRFDIKTLIPLIWGIQQVNEYDKTFYSVMAVSRSRIQKTRLDGKSEFVGLNTHTQMQQLVDSISVEDEIFSIQFKVCIITTSIGKNFKYVEFETIKLEDNYNKKKLHIYNLKMCLNDILKNELVVMFKDFSDGQTRLLDQSKFLDAPLEHSKIIEPDSSFAGKGSNPHRIGSSQILKDNQEDSIIIQPSVSNEINNNTNKKRMFKNNLNNHIRTNFREDSMTGQRDDMISPRGFNSGELTPESAGDYSQALSQEIRFQKLLRQNRASHKTATITSPNAAVTANTMNLQSPVSTDRNRLLDMTLPLETGYHHTLSSRREINTSAISPRGGGGFDQTSIHLQSPRILEQQHFFPQSKHIVDLHSNHDLDQLVESSSSKESSSQEGTPSHKPPAIGLFSKKLPSKPNIPIESPTSPQYFDSLPIYQSKHELIVEEDDYDESNVNDFDQLNQNEAITSYRALMKTNKELRTAKSKHLSVLIQQQNTFRSLQTYNNEMKLSVDKSIVARKEGDHSVPEQLSYTNLPAPVATVPVIPNGALQSSLQIGSNLEVTGAPASGNPSKSGLQISAEQIQIKLMQSSSTDSHRKQFDTSFANDDEDEFSGSGGNNNQQNKHTNGQNTPNQKSKRTKKTQNEAQSINSSSRTSEESRRKLIVRRIRSHHISKGLILMLYIGVFSFLVFMAITWTFYAENYSSYNSYIDEFQKINKSSLMYVDVISVAKIYSYFAIGASQTEYASDVTLSTARLKLYVDDYRTNLEYFTNDSDKQNYYSYMLNQKISLNYYHYDDDITYSTTVRIETHYLAMMKFFFIIQQIKDTMVQADYDFIWSNIIQFRTNMLEMQTLIQNQASEQFDSIRQIQIVMLLVILAITSVLIFTIIPLSIYNTIQCEEILRLFGCFQPDKIQKIVDLIEIAVNKLNVQELAREEQTFHIQELRNQSAIRGNQQTEQQYKHAQTIKQFSPKTDEQNELQEPTSIVNQEENGQVGNTADHSSKKSGGGGGGGGKQSSKVNNQNDQSDLIVKKPKGAPVHKERAIDADVKSRKPRDRSIKTLGTTLFTKKAAQVLMSIAQKAKGQQKQNQGHASNQRQKTQIHHRTTLEPQSTNEISNGTHRLVHHNTQSGNALMMTTMTKKAISTLTQHQQKVSVKRLPQKRTRQMASFNTLPRINFLIVGIAMVVLAFVMVPPVLNIVVSNEYMAEGKVTLNERIIVLNAISHLIRNQALHYAIWYDSTLTSFSGATDSLTYFQYIKSITSESDAIIHDLQSLLESTVSRRNQEEYEKYYSGLLSGDQCTVLPTVPQRVDSNITEDQCETLSKGIMKRGFVVAMKYFLDSFASYYESYILNIQNVKTVYTDIMADDGLHDQYQSIIYIFEVFETLDAYSSWAQQAYNDYIQQIIKVLFICYIIVVVFIFLSGWTQGYRKFKREFNSTKELLALFNLNIILENVFLVQFLKNNEFGIK